MSQLIYTSKLAKVYALLKQSLKGGLDAVGTVRLGQILMGNQELGHMQSVVSEQVFIVMHEMGLTHGGEGLGSVQAKQSLCVQERPGPDRSPFAGTMVTG